MDDISKLKAVSTDEQLTELQQLLERALDILDNIGWKIDAAKLSEILEKVY